MAVLDDMDVKLDQLLSLMGEEINVLPDMLMPGSESTQSLVLTTNSAVPLWARFSVVDRPDGRYLCLMLRGPNYEVLHRREWRAVFRDPLTQTVYARPGQIPK